MLPSIVLVVVLGAPPTDAHGDPLPPGAVARFGTVRWRGMGNSAAISPDGKTVVVDWMNGFEAWDLGTGVRKYRVAVPFLPTEGVFNKRPVAFTPDGSKLVVVAGHDLQVHDAASGKLQSRFDCAAALAGVAGLRGANGVVLRDATAVMYGTDWILPVDWRTGKPLRMWRPNDTLFTVSVDGTRLAVRTDTGTQMHDAVTGRPLGEELPIRSRPPVLSPDGSRIAIGSENSIAVYHTATRLKEFTATVPPDVAPSLPPGPTFSADGRVLFVAEYNGPIHRFEVPSGRRIEPPLPRDPAGPSTRLLATQDGATVISVSSRGSIRRWATATGQSLPNGEGFCPEFALAVSPSGRRVAAADADGALRISVLPTAGPGVAVREKRNWSRVAWLNDDTLLTADQTGDVRTWRADGTGGATLCNVPKAAPNHRYTGFRDLTTSPDGRTFAAVTADGYRLWAADGTLRWHRKLDFGEHRLFFAPDGQSLYAREYRGPGRRISADTGSDVQTHRPSDGRSDRYFPAHGNSVAPDGRTFAASVSKYVRFCRTADGEPIGQWNLPEMSNLGNNIATASLSGDGSLAAAGTNDGRVFVIDRRTNLTLLAFDRHAGKVAALHFLPTGRHLLSRGDDGTALLWDLRPTYTATAAEDGWAGLLSSDGLKAYAAVWHLADHFDDYAAEVRTKFPPVAVADPIPVAGQHIAQLDSPKFADRETALKALRKLVSEFPGLRAACAAEAAKSPSAEVRAKLEGLLGKADDGPTAADIFRGRVVAAAERSEKAEAKRVIREWAAGTPGARLTIEAQAVLNRAGEK